MVLMKMRTVFEINTMLLVWLSELFRIITFKGQFWAGLKWSKLAKFPPFPLLGTKYYASERGGEHIHALLHFYAQV